MSLFLDAGQGYQVADFRCLETLMSELQRVPVGRLAPSPTGAQHVGNARTFLVAWLSMRQLQGRVILRIEDLDSPRVKAEATQQAIEDLHWLGLDWDEGPDIGGPHSPYIQTQRSERFSEILAKLAKLELIYPCRCTRTDLQTAASAPHWEHEGPVYPGTCASFSAGQASEFAAGSYAWRFRVASGERQFLERERLAQRCDVARELGDFVIAKKDQTAAYQLAVVCDDHDMHVTQVVRGDDLLASTFRQLQIYEALGWQPPSFFHVPLVVGTDQRRLAKRHGDTRLATLREQGVCPRRLIGLLAHSLGLIPQPTPISPAELIERFDWNLIPVSTPWVFDDSQWRTLVGD